MKKLITFILLIVALISYKGIAQTTLSAGDIMIVGFNADDDDSGSGFIGKNIAFVLFKNITAGTVIKFTDDGWKSSGDFVGSEGIVTFTANQNYSKFDVILSPNVYHDATGEWNRPSGSFNPSTSGDQILVYQGTEASPTFITAIQFNASSWESDATNSNNSALPTGLTNGVDAIAVGNTDDAMYTGGISNDVSTLKSKIQDVTNNWTTSNSTLDLSSTPAPLPVELSSFSANSIENSVELKWKTSTEKNNYGFEVQRTIQNSQLKINNWEKIGFVKGSGNSNSLKNYSFVDEKVSTGKYSYRLKQIDNDGAFQYSKVVEVNLGAPTEFNLAQNYPNPFNPTTKIEFSIPKSSRVRITVYNSLGEKVKTLINSNLSAGAHSITFKGDNLSSGIYIYKLSTDNSVRVKKMMLLK